MRKTIVTMVLMVAVAAGCGSETPTEETVGTPTGDSTAVTYSPAEKETECARMVSEFLTNADNAKKTLDAMTAAEQQQVTAETETLAASRREAGMFILAACEDYLDEPTRLEITALSIEEPGYWEK